MREEEPSGATIDLEVHLGWGRDGTYRASTTWEGRATRTPLAVDVEAALGTLRAGAAATRHAREARRKDAPPPEPGSASRVGSTLFTAMFAGAMREAYAESRKAAEKAGKPWRLVLVVDADPLARVPWELLHDPDRGEFLACHGSLVRRPATGGRAVPPPAAERIRISWVAASPRDHQILDIARERQMLEQALSAVPDSPQRPRPALADVDPTPESLFRLLEARHADPDLQDRELHVLHFACHGELSGDEGRLVLQTPAGDSHTVSASTLARAILQDRSVRLVVLNACEGAASTSEDALSSVAALLAARGVPAVIGMSTPILDELAVSLTAYLYEALLRTGRIDEALRAARHMLQVRRPEWSENGPWASPVLWLSGEGAEWLSRPSEGPRREEAIPPAPPPPAPPPAPSAPPPPSPLPPPPAAVFKKPPDVVYLAAEDDAKHMGELAKQLRPTLRKLALTDWHVSAAEAGLEPEAALDAAVAAARVVVLLISSDYLDDPLCQRGQTAALDRASRGGLWIVPVYVRPIDPGIYKSQPFGRMTSTPRSNKYAPVTQQPDRDTAWAEVAGAVRKVLEGLEVHPVT